MEITAAEFFDLLARRYVGMTGQHVDSRFFTGETNYVDIAYSIVGNVIATARKVEGTKFYPSFLRYFEGVAPAA